MPAVTASQVILDAAADLNIFQQGETLSTPGIDANIPVDMLRRLNLMIGGFAQQGDLIPAVARVVAPLLSGKGASTNPYTIGVGGDINTARPPNQNSIVGAGLLFGTPVSPPGPLEVPRAVLTNDMWENLRLKNLPSVLFTDVYYRPDFSGDLGSIFLYPVPTDLANSLVLYIQQGLTTFVDLTTTYYVPPGYDDMLHFNLAMKLAVPYGRPISPDLREQAETTLANVKRSNASLSDLSNDLAAIGTGRTRQGWYDLIAGTGG